MRNKQAVIRSDNATRRPGQRYVRLGCQEVWGNERSPPHPSICLACDFIRWGCPWEKSQLYSAGWVSNALMVRSTTGRTNLWNSKKTCQRGSHTNSQRNMTGPKRGFSSIVADIWLPWIGRNWAVNSTKQNGTTSKDGSRPSQCGPTAFIRFGGAVKQVQNGGFDALNTIITGIGRTKQ